MSDKELIQLLKQDPEKGLEAVVIRYTAYVMKIARTKLDNICTQEDMEETVSDVFFAFYRQGQKCGFEIRSLRAYISLIAERHCVDIFRQRVRQDSTIPLDDVAATLACPESGDYDMLAEAIKQLGEPDTSIFIRKYFYGQRSANIAKEHHMKANTVDKRISRGLIRLRKLMEER